MGLTDVDAAAALPRVKSKPGVARPAPDRVYLEALMRSKPRTRLYLRLAAELGLRRAEIAQVHSDDLIEDLVGWSLLVHGKGNRERVVPLTPGIAAELRTLGVGFAFPGDRDGHVSPEWVGKQASRAMEGKWTIHTLRHRFAARTYAIDADLFVVQELLGHASPATTRRYVPRASAAKARRIVLAAAGADSVPPAASARWASA
jgi:integrase